MCTPNNVPYISIETKHMILLTEAKKYNEFEVIADQLNNRINNFILKLQKINIIDDINVTPITITDLPIIIDNTYNIRKIYRTKKNDINFYLLDTINESKLSFYIDNKKDDDLQEILLNKSEFTLINNVSNIENYRLVCYIHYIIKIYDDIQ